MTKKEHSHSSEHAEQVPSEGAPAAANPAAEFEDLRQQLEQAKQQATENLDGWKRSQAEFENYRKRLSRDLENDRAQTLGRVAARWFPLLDDLDRALCDRPSAEKLDKWFEGIQNIQRKGQAVFEAEGIELIIPEPGTEFNPALHEALTMEPHAELAENEIIAAVRKGYRLGDKVLRPAQVRVACKPPA